MARAKFKTLTEQKKVTALAQFKAQLDKYPSLEGVMICGNIFSSALNGSILRDHTPEGAAGKMQGVRMIAGVLIPMIVGPAIGNSINKAAGVLLENPGADAMTTEYIPAPEIFLVGSIVAVVTLAVIPIIRKAESRKTK